MGARRVILFPPLLFFGGILLSRVFEFGTGALRLVMSQAFPPLLATVCAIPATGVGRGERGGDRR